jgi:hypothetical protein
MKQQENNITFHPLINLGIFTTILEDFDENYWIKEVYNYKKTNPISVFKSNKGGWQSESSLHLQPSFFSLCKKLQNIFYTIFPNPQRIIDGMWINISSYTNFNSPHQHGDDSYPYQLYSGIIYLNTPTNSGDVIFMNPLNLGLGHSFTPQPKQVILFPSPIQHYVEPNFSQEDRISIAFNFN